MEWWLGLGGFATLLVVWIVYALFNNKHVATEDEFRQAGIVVNFKNSTVKIKGKIYSIDDIKSWRSESQSGGWLNGSAAYIHLNDFKRPMHMIAFITPNAAKIFLQRLISQSNVATNIRRETMQRRRNRERARKPRRKAPGFRPGPFSFERGPPSWPGAGQKEPPGISLGVNFL